MSILRIAGYAAGLLLVLLSLYRFRSYDYDRHINWILFTFGAGLMAVALFPDLMTLPRQALSLKNVSGGRIIFILMMVTVALSVIIVIERGKLFQVNQEVGKVFRWMVLEDFFKTADFPGDADFILVLIPAYNEEENLREILPKIPATIEGMPVRAMVIDDGSADATREAAQSKNAYVATHPLNKGQGAALKTGFDIVERTTARVVVTMDADGQHRPEDIPLLVQPILAGDADIVIGSRQLGESTDDSMVRDFGVIFFSRLVSLIMGVTITDCSSGFRAINPEKFRSLKLHEDQYVANELIIDAAKNGLRIVERPITIVKRLSGVSKKGHNFVYALRFFLATLKAWLR